MGERSRSFLKARFQTGAHPNESDFGDLIDSPINWEDVGVVVRSLVSAETTAQARNLFGITGVSGDVTMDDVGDVSATSPVSGDVIIYVDASSEWGRQPTGTFGRTHIAASSTSDYQNALGGGSAGILSVEAETSADFQKSAGIGDAGLKLVNTDATASLKSLAGIIVGPTLEFVMRDEASAETTTLSFDGANYISLRMECVSADNAVETGQAIYNWIQDHDNFNAYVSGKTFGLMAPEYPSFEYTKPLGTTTNIANNDHFKNFKVVATVYKI